MFGKKCRSYGYCIHANRKLMKCFPGSKDCVPEYDLDEDDFSRECECDFYEAIKNDSYEYKKVGREGPSLLWSLTCDQSDQTSLCGIRVGVSHDCLPTSEVFWYDCEVIVHRHKRTSERNNSLLLPYFYTSLLRESEKLEI